MSGKAPWSCITDPLRAACQLNVATGSEALRATGAHRLIASISERDHPRRGAVAAVEAETGPPVTRR
jgi:hypothetical protein